MAVPRTMNAQKRNKKAVPRTMNAQKRNKNRDTSAKLKAQVSRKKARDRLTPLEQLARMKLKKEWR